jgi:hypothetical protein
MLSETLTQLVQTYGFQVVYQELMSVSNTLLQKYKSEISFIESLGVPNTPKEIQNPVVENTTKEIQITGPVVQDALEKGEGKEISVSEVKIRKMKVIRKNGRFIKVDEHPTEDVINEFSSSVVVQRVEEIQQQVNTEVKNTVVQNTEGKRTPKEIKKWQRDMESARRKYMKENNITQKSVLVEDQIKQYLGEGKTYAWIAREITGQKEEEVSKWCKERGLIKKGTFCPLQALGHA